MLDLSVKNLTEENNILNDFTVRERLYVLKNLLDNDLINKFEYNIIRNEIFTREKVIAHKNGRASM